VGLYEETNTDLLAPMPEGFQRLKSLHVDFSGQRPLKPFKLSIPQPAGVPSDAQVFIAREVNVFGQKKLMVVDTTAINDGRIQASSPPWPGCTAAGIYTMILNQSLQLGFISGTVGAPGLAVHAMDLVFITTSTDFIMPVRIGQNITITVSDMDTGDTLYEKVMPGPTVMGQVYSFGKVSNDKEPPLLLRSTGIESLTFDVTAIEVKSKGITIKPIPNALTGKVESIAIFGDGVATVDSGRIRVYKLINNTFQEQSPLITVDENGDFQETTYNAVNSDRFILTIEKGGVPTNQEFVLSFSEPIKDPQEYEEAQTPIELYEIDKESGEEKIIDIFSERLPSQTDLVIRPRIQLKDGTTYQLQLKEISDWSENKIALTFDFQTDQSRRIDFFGMQDVYDTLLIGGYLYVAEGYMGLRVLDVSNPANMMAKTEYRNFAGGVKGLAGMAMINWWWWAGETPARGLLKYSIFPM